MNRRHLERQLDTLSRTELRALAADLVQWLGPDAVVRLLPSAPIVDATEQRQLPLDVVDAGACAARLGHIVAAVVGAYRGRAAGMLDGRMAETVAAMAGHALSELAGHIADAVRFDARAGFPLVESFVASCDRLDAARDAFAPDVAAVLVDQDDLARAVEETLGRVAIDEATLNAIVDLAERASPGRQAATWRWVRAAVGGPAADGPSWLLRRLERSRRSRHAGALLAVLGEAVGGDEARDVLSVAELHVDDGPEVIDFIVDHRIQRHQLHEARFWIGEGRRRYPGRREWDTLEERSRRS